MVGDVGLEDRLDGGTAQGKEMERSDGGRSGASFERWRAGRRMNRKDEVDSGMVVRGSKEEATCGNRGEEEGV